jgi:uncharacterized protein (TIGR02117 family)
MGAGVRLLLSALFAPVLAYLAAMVVLGLLPANAGWVEAEEGVVVFVNTNGVHTGIGMPVANEVMDWRPFMPAAHLKTPIAADYVFVGYGHRAFYLETESWADLSPKLALDAAFGGGATLVHVDHVQGPGKGPEQRAVTLSREEYRRLVTFVRARFTLDAAGRTVPLPGRGYGEHDAFYEAEGGYSLWLTCNEWTGRALRAAGVRMGFWTPLEQAVMWRLP